MSRASSSGKTEFWHHHHENAVSYNVMISAPTDSPTEHQVKAVKPEALEAQLHPATLRHQRAEVGPVAGAPGIPSV